MNFSYIFILYFAISFLYGATADSIPAQKESMDIGVDSPKMELLSSKEPPEEIDNIIRQRRKTIEELLNNFREDMKREQDTVDEKRSLHLKNQKYPNHWRRADDNIKNLQFDRNVQDFSDERNGIPLRAIISNNSEAVTESNPENLNLNNMEGSANNSDVTGDRNVGQENRESLKNISKNNRKQNAQNQESPRGMGPMPRHSIKADYFNADLQDYDDEDYHVTNGGNPRNSYGYTPDFGNSRRFKGNPYTCCLCDDCKPLNVGVRNCMFQHYMRSNVVRPTESDHLTGAREKEGVEFASFKYPVGDRELKSYEKVPYHDSHLQISNAPLIDPYALYRNNLSHEANYKLSKLEQDPGENQKNFSWLWPNWGLQKRRSLQFNPMNEIKLKTSSRLMERGCGPSLPSYSLGENRREYMIDNILKRKELDFQKDNGKYHDLEAVAGVADPAELGHPESWNDFDISETKSNANENDWNRIRKKRISERQSFMEENKDEDEDEEKPLRDLQGFKREAKENVFFSNQAPGVPISNDYEGLNHVKNTNHRTRRSKRSANVHSIPRQHNMTKRDVPFLKGSYEDDNSFQHYTDLNSGHYQDLIDNDLESLNKVVGRVDPQRENNANFDKNLYKREQHQRLQQLQGNIKDNRWEDQNRYLKRNINSVKLNKTGYMDVGKYLRFKEPSDNYENLKSQLDSKWRENEGLRQKKYARIPHRQPKKKKGNSNTKGRVGAKDENGNLIPLESVSNKAASTSGSFNIDNLNKFDKFHEYSNKIWPRHLYKHYPDLRHRSTVITSRSNTSGFPSTDNTPESNDTSDKISLELRNEILNCTAFSSLKEFLKTLPLNTTRDLMGTTATEGSEEIEMDFTTLDIKELTTENPAWTTTELSATQESYTEMEETTDFESSKVPDTWESSTLDYSDITETPNSTEEDFETSATPMPEDDNNSSWDDPLSGSTCSPKSLPSSSLGPGSDDVKLNITINANVQGSSKTNKFNGNGTINVKPGFADNRYGRHVQKRKCSHRPQTSGSVYDYDEDLFNDLSSGKVSGNIVKAVFDEVQANPDLQVLWPSLERNQLSEKTPLPYLYNLRDKDNEDQIQNSKNLMAKTMDAINNIIDQQVRSRSCVVLRPDLQDFYDLIVKSNQQQESGREKRENYKERLITKDQASIPNVQEDKTKTVKKLLRQYEELPQQEQQEVKPIRDILLSELSEMEEKRKDGPERQTRDMAEDGHLGVVRAYDDITNLLKKYYTPEFLKLQKASDLYRSITNESDDGMP